MTKTNIQDLFDQQANKHHLSHHSPVRSPETLAKTGNKLKGREVWNKGVPCTETRAENISAAKKGKPNPKKYKPIMTPQGQFESAQAAARAMGITYPGLWSIMKRNPNDYYYIKD